MISGDTGGVQRIGNRGPFAEDLYAAATPPAWGLSARHEISERVANVRIGDELRVARDDFGWSVSDLDGVLGRLRWRLADDGAIHRQTGVRIRLPASGTLKVTQVLLSADGVVADIGGVVYPA